MNNVQKFCHFNNTPSTHSEFPYSDVKQSKEQTYDQGIILLKNVIREKHLAMKKQVFIVIKSIGESMQ
jgi:hypothetical protein